MRVRTQPGVMLLAFTDAGAASASFTVSAFNAALEIE